MSFRKKNDNNNKPTLDFHVNIDAPLLYFQVLFS